MARFFNTAGPCLPDKHYMIPSGRRLGQIWSLIEVEAYYVIHAPRQSGKTTLLKDLARALNTEGRYAALMVSLESFTEPDKDREIPRIISAILADAGRQLPVAQRPPADGVPEDNPSVALREFLANWCAQLDRPLVLLLDEVDSLPPPVLVSVLRQLRDGHNARPAPFPQSVALCGLRDLRDYKQEIRPDGESRGTTSPFNIKTESLTLRSFSAEEVSELLGQHTAETGQPFTAEADAEIFHQSQGQPWLVNALAAWLTTRYDALVPERSEPVERHHVLAAREILIERRDTHLDSLVDRLGEERVRRVIEPILVGSLPADATYDDDFSYARDLGLVTVQGGLRTIANPIYQEVIPRVLTHQTQTAIPLDPAWFVAEDGTLVMPRLIEGFVQFWREHGEVLLRGMPYHEAAPHLSFMAYLQRVINAGGQVHRELAVGTGRADLVVERGGRRDIIELKRAQAYKALERGLEQVSRYAQRLGRDVGYLVLFDPESSLPWEQRGTVEEHEHGGVRVVILRA
jgi:hypothetical protein